VILLLLACSLQTTPRWTATSATATVRARLDSNGDGRLSVAELAVTDLPGSASSPASTTAAMDTNEDGFISPAELEAWIRTEDPLAVGRMGPHPLQVP